jgi:hypothetical protein
MPNHFSAYPNPFRDELSFEVEVDNNLSAIIRISDKDGKIMKLLSWNLKKGTNKTSLNDLENWSAGEYFLDMKDMKGDSIFNLKLVKQ